MALFRQFLANMKPPTATINTLALNFIPPTNAACTFSCPPNNIRNNHRNPEVDLIGRIFFMLNFAPLYLDRQTMNLLAVLARLSSMTMLSRVLGFIRDAVVARVFGAGAAMDAFVVAFRLPNLLRRIFAEGAFSQAFVPVLAEYRQNQSPENTQRLVQHVAGMLSFVLCIVTAIGVLAAPVVIWLTASGLNDGTRFDLAVSLLRVVFPYILLISLSSFVGSILNTYSQFSIPAFTPVLLNISFIVFAVFLVPYFGTRLGGAGGRRVAVVVPAALAVQAGFSENAEAGFPRCRREPHFKTNGAFHYRLFRSADFSGD